MRERNGKKKGRKGRMIATLSKLLKGLSSNKQFMVGLDLRERPKRQEEEN